MHTYKCAHERKHIHKSLMKILSLPRVRMRRCNGCFCIYDSSLGVIRIKISTVGIYQSFNACTKTVLLTWFNDGAFGMELRVFGKKLLKFFILKILLNFLS